MHKKSMTAAVMLALFACTSVHAFAAEPQAIPSYRKALEAFTAERAAEKDSSFTAEEQAVMARAKDNLAARMPDPGIKVGERAPDFSLPDAFGKTVTLSETLKQGPVVLVFYRGAWCPFCNLHLRTLNESLPAFKRHGAQLVMVTPQKPDKSAEQLKKDGYPFIVLSDLDSRVMKAYRLYFELDPELVALYKKHGLDIEDFNGDGRNVLPVPGTFVIDTGGVVRAMHANTDYMQRMEPAAIVAALAAMDDKQAPTANVKAGNRREQ